MILEGIAALYEEAYLMASYAPDVLNGFFRQWAKHLKSDYKTIGDAVDEAMQKTGKKRVNLAGHSFGGLVALAYTMENPDNVAKCVTIGTPIQGTPLAPFLYGLMGMGIFPASASQMLPEGKLITAMNSYFKKHNREFMEKNVTFENVRSTHDSLCPYNSASLNSLDPDAWNIEEHDLKRRGHVGVLHDRKTCRLLADIAAYSFYPTIFIPGFSLGRHSFELLVQSIKKECPEEADLLGRMDMLCYDYTKPINAEKILSEHGK